MDEERELIPADEQVEGSEVTVISRLFDQAALLVVQVYNSIGSQRRLNILSPLIDSNTKVLGDIERRVIKIG